MHLTAGIPVAELRLNDDLGTARARRVIQDQPTDAVCDALAISEENLFVRLHRARKQLLS